MNDDRNEPVRGFSTRAIRAASRTPRVDQRPTSVPIYQTATFASHDAQELGDVAGEPRSGYAYSRISNPTTNALGDAYAELAGGERGLALASGMGAIHAALASQLRAGDRVLAPLAIYGSTRAQLLHTFAGFGVEVAFVDATDPAAVTEALAAHPTRVLYAETIANPTTFVSDHARLATLAHEHGATYIVDNTFASPYVCRPLDLGADLVVEIGHEVPGRPQRRDRGCRRRPRGAHREGRAGPDRHRRDGWSVRCLPGPARHPDPGHPDGAPCRDGVGPGDLAGGPRGRAASPLSGPGQPSPAGGGHAPVPVRRGRRDAGDRRRRRSRSRPSRHRLAARDGTDRVPRERPHDRRPPTFHVAATAVRDQSFTKPGSPRGSCASRSASRTSRICRPISSSA
ncbi:MAG: aminotransferase class I/II-fold pyridoxal phosphate-dependent enzyme [Candidatus Limnocylindrales bacterium]